jgi:hypothetical protein
VNRVLCYRIAALVRSAKTLNSVVHFQSLAAAGRSVFELGMDVMLFGADKTTESLVRLKAFEQVEKFRNAELTARFYRGNPAPVDWSIAEQVALAGDGKEQAAVAALKKQ